MNIFNYEIKDKIKSSIMWSISIIALLFLFMAVFPAFSGDTKSLSLIMENYPEEMLKAFGMSDVDLSTVSGYSTMTILFTQILLAMQASIYGFSVLSVEERELTADFLLTKPVTRTKIFISKLFSALFAMIITYGATFGGMFLTVSIFDNTTTFDANEMIKILLPLILFQLMFFGIGLVISVSVKKIKSVLSFSMALTFGFYIISAMGSIIDSKYIEYLTPYKYFEPGKVIINGNYGLEVTLISIAVIIATLIASYILYIKRNIHSAT